jgi:hypothetical protein
VKTQRRLDRGDAPKPLNEALTVAIGMIAGHVIQSAQY